MGLTCEGITDNGDRIESVVSFTSFLHPQHLSKYNFVLQTGSVLLNVVSMINSFSATVHNSVASML